jgi:hypothetical protein
MKGALVAVGVDRVGGGLDPLRAAADGAIKMTQWAKGQGFDTSVLTDQESAAVTLSAVSAAVHHFVTQRIYDLLVIYFSGHGLLKGSNYEIWLLSGAPFEPNEAVNVAGSIDLARASGIAHVVFISDACRSIPTTIEMNYVLGGVIFPAQAPRAPSPEVDTFYATLPGNPALELPPDQSIPNFRGIFTDCMLAALKGRVAEVARDITDAGMTRVVIPARPLKPYLLHAVPDAASAASVRLQQDPEIRVESDLPKYICDYRTIDEAADRLAYAREELSHDYLDQIEVGGDRSYELWPPPRGFFARLRALFRRRRYAQWEQENRELRQWKQRELDRWLRNESLSSKSISEMATQKAEIQFMRFRNEWVKSKDVESLLSAKGRQTFETRTGFTVHGAKVVSAVTGAVRTDVFEESGLSQVRVHASGYDYGESPYSTVIRFDSGTGACLAALREYVGTVIVEAGRVVAVNYTPARGTSRYSEYEEVSEDLEKRRAQAAVNARYGTFALPRSEASSVAESLRMLKSIDPTLGIYAAYAYAQGGDQEGVESVYEFMRETGSSSGVPFDVAMLAFRFNSDAGRLRCAPNFPMLTQGWALLGAVEDRLLPLARAARQHLVPSLWTTFSEAGLHVLEEGVKSGDLQ